MHFCEFINHALLYICVGQSSARGASSTLRLFLLVHHPALSMITKEEDLVDVGDGDIMPAAVKLQNKVK